MRRTTIGRAALALLIAGATALVGASAMSAAGAQTTSSATPSCSLHPTRNGDGTVSFRNVNGSEHFLQVIDQAALLFNAMLQPGETTPPLTLTPAASIGWAGSPYPLSAYDTVGWCAADEPTTTTTAPPVVTVPPPTITTPPPSTVVTPTTTPTTEPPVLSCAADDRCETFGPAAPPVSLDQQIGAAIPETLPVTGSDTGVLVMLGTSLLVLGAAALALVRVRHPRPVAR